MKRVPDLIDVWFDSGAIPVCSVGIRSRKTQKAGDPIRSIQPFDKNYPADYIAEIRPDKEAGSICYSHAIARLTIVLIRVKAL